MTTLAKERYPAPAVPRDHNSPQKAASMLRLFRALLVIVPCLLSSVAMSQQPNIVWISCEDISPHLGCYGDPHAITPNLDREGSQKKDN